jgi:hypothetical protein
VTFARQLVTQCLAGLESLLERRTRRDEPIDVLEALAVVPASHAGVHHRDFLEVSGLESRKALAGRASGKL